ncbi:hypothetical protein [Bacillus mobilis]|uniref:hypothetical protein n=1 Tax=Bacillus mobilis TaxID=2026190 RepID=UPI000B199B98|nr:hypothetical protein [Bacillus mobilis]
MNKLTYKAILKKYNPGTNKAGREVRSITFFAKDIKGVASGKCVFTTLRKFQS